MRGFLIYSIALMPWSWMLGIAVNYFAEKSRMYTVISNQVFIKNDRINRWIGLEAFKWIVMKTFFRHFNQKIKIDSRLVYADLVQLRKDMIFSEMSHLFAFILVLPFVLLLILHYNNYLFAGTLLAANLAFNLYPSLLQQKNKRRLDRVIASYSR